MDRPTTKKAEAVIAKLTRLQRGLGGNVRIALVAINARKLRAVLTTLGIVVGVSTVIAMVAVVSGFNNNVIGNLQAFGANRIEFQKHEDRFGPGGPSDDEEHRRQNLTIEDAAALRDGIPAAAAVSAMCGYVDAEIHVKNGNLEANLPYLLGADEWYLPGTAYTLAHGRFFTPMEVRVGALVTVLGADVNDAIFPHQDPIGKDVTINGMTYLVVGILARKGAQFGWSPDNKLVLPFGTFERQFGFRIRADGVGISVVPRRPEDIDQVIETGTAILRQRRRVPFNKASDFAISTPDQLISQFQAITGGVTGAMVLIAGISLVIGGVGVMNIMLVSVTERTREIGVRRAVGAYRRDIVSQFLIEAVTLTTFGGILGLILGISVALAVRAFVPSLPTSIPAWSLIVAPIVSTLVGVFFGMYPAVKASRLDPIESLRYE